MMLCFSGVLVYGGISCVVLLGCVVCLVDWLVTWLLKFRVCV